MRPLATVCLLLVTSSFLGQAQVVPADKAEEAHIDGLLKQMTLEEKMNLIRGDVEPAATNQGLIAGRLAAAPGRATLLMRRLLSLDRRRTRWGLVEACGAVATSPRRAAPWAVPCSTRTAPPTGRRTTGPCPDRSRSARRVRAAAGAHDFRFSRQRTKNVRLLHGAGGAHRPGDGSDDGRPRERRSGTTGQIARRPHRQEG